MVRGVTHQTHSHMYNSIYTHGDCFRLRPEIWPWRQDYGGRPSLFFPLSLGFLPWRPWPITQCFLNLCFNPEEDDLPLLSFSEAAPTFLDQDPWRTARQYGKMKRALCQGGLIMVPLPGHVCWCAKGRKTACSLCQNCNTSKPALMNAGRRSHSWHKFKAT